MTMVEKSVGFADFRSDGNAAVNELNFTNCLASLSILVVVAGAEVALNVLKFSIASLFYFYITIFCCD